MNKYIFPAVMVLLNLSQAAVMLAHKNYISVVYWVSAAALNGAVALM